MRERLKAELSKLITHGKWDLLRKWFSVWESEEEMSHKCHLWGFMFMPTYFRAKGSPAHLELIKENLSNKNEYSAWPRGHAKTTCGQLTACFEIANHTQEFIVLIEKSFTEASTVLSSIREVFDSPLVNKVYGKLIGHTIDGDEAERMPDARGDVFINGVRIRAMGFNKTIRGLKSNAWRPTKIYMDDVEEDDHIGNPEQRKKYMDNFLKGIVPSVDIDGCIKVRGTILHFDSLLYNLIQRHHGKIHKAYDRENPEKTLLWPEYWTMEKLMHRRAQMEEAGRGVNAFYQEYLNEPIAEGERDFRWEDITKTYKEEELKYRQTNLFAALDVADSTGAGHDYTGCVVEAIDENGNWFNRVTKRYRVDILGLINLIFELWNMDGMRKIGVEKKAYEDQIKPLLDLESQKRGQYPVVVELKHGGKRKIDRIKGNLQGLYRQGKIFNRENPEDDTRVLWDQLYSIGGGIIASKNDDLADGKSYIAQIAEKPVTEEYRSRYNKERKSRHDPLHKIRKDPLSDMNILKK